MTWSCNHKSKSTTKQNKIESKPPSEFSSSVTLSCPWYSILFIQAAEQPLASPGLCNHQLPAQSYSFQQNHRINTRVLFLLSEKTGRDLKITKWTCLSQELCTELASAHSSVCSLCEGKQKQRLCVRFSHGWTWRICDLQEQGQSWNCRKLLQCWKGLIRKSCSTMILFLNCILWNF